MILSPKDTVRAYVDAFNAGDWDRLRALFTQDAQVSGVLGSTPLESALVIWRELNHGMRTQLEIEALAEDGASSQRAFESGAVSSVPFAASRM